MIYFTPNVVALLVLGILSALLMAAVWSDIRTYRIPNKLVLLGTGVGLLANTILPEGSGFVSSLPGALGIMSSLTGLLTGFALLMPLYLLRGMGAGDVKLVAMIGAFLGTNVVIGIVILTFLIGGLLSITVAISNKTLRRLFQNLWIMAITGHFKLVTKEAPVIDAPATSSGKLPYALPIALGTASYIYIISNYPNFFRFI